MKRLIKALVVFFVAAAFAFIPPKHNLVGHWASTNPAGEETA
jgi:hypothetical protein